MPTGTFFRLPEEKKTRLIQAAWDEFTRVTFADASINRIIQSAHIPRGSFYQYFTDKEDLFVYILNTVRDFFTDILERILKDSGGDLFSATLQTYDGLLAESAGTDLRLRRFGDLLRLNPELGLRSILSSRPDCLPRRILQMVDISCFRRKEPDFIEHTCSLLFFSLGSSLIASLFDLEKQPFYRQALQSHIDIIRCGSQCPTIDQ